jgi:phosphoribosyl 1,2-cyclic phosphodiesterase
MKIKLWGVRGSIPTTGPDTAFYGGHTSSLCVAEDDCLLILDAGSGIQEFNSLDLPSTNRVDVLLTHLHMDHIQGLGFFKALFIPDLEVHIWGPMSNTSLHSRLSRYLSPPLFPVLLRDLPCKLKLHEIGNGDYEVGKLKVKASYIIHPGPTLGYRINGKHSAFTYIPDHEPALGPGGLINDGKWTSGYEIAHDADLLYHDGQYTATEYNTKKGWGHSSYTDALQYASITGVKHLVIGHHDPTHNDARLKEIFSTIQGKNIYKFKYELAKEGREYELE